ncbi:hypothetical protein [Streptomyces sp. NPDC002690]
MTDVDPARPRTVVPAQRQNVTRDDLLRAVLWVVTVAGATANTVASYRGSSLTVHLVCGLVTALGVGALIMTGRWRRRR